VILADYTLPRFTALGALALLQERGLTVPFIVVTGRTNEEAPVECMKNGAADYLIKDRLARLGPAILQALDAARAREAKRKAEEQVTRRDRERTLLTHIIAASATSADEGTFLQKACDELALALGASQAFAALFDDARSGAVVVAESCAVPGLSVMGVSFPFDGSSMGRMLAELREPFRVDRLSDSRDLALVHGGLVAHGISSVAVLPLSVDDTPVGMLGLAVAEPGHFGEEKLALVSSVASEMSQALARIRLERDHMRLSAAAEQISDAIIFSDVNGRVQYVNASFEKMSGWTKAETRGRSACVITGRGDEEIWRRLREIARRDGEWHGRIVNHRKDGAPYTTEVSLSPIRDRGGEVVNFVGILRDITEELEKEERFLQAQKMEAVGRLAGGVAHDFNNILTTITGYVDLLSARVPPGSPPHEELAFIQGAATRAAGLTRQLLAFSRKQVLQPQVLNLNAVLDEVKVMLKPLVRDDVELRIVAEPRLRPVKADPVQLVQVVMNLAVNARDAMPGGGMLTLTTANVELDAEPAEAQPGVRPGSYVRLSVEDTGIGIPVDEQAHVFEPFFTTKPEGKGTGLGLATVYGIVKQSGGHIALWSEPGMGARFEIYLPESLEEHAEQPGAPRARAARQGTEAILFAEDDAGVRRMIATVLRGLGYAVKDFGSPRDALASVESGERFDLLLSDVVMPGLGGRELAERVRLLIPGIKVLYISGYTNQAFADGVGLEPRAAFLQKPFTSATLAQAVRAILDRETGRSPAAGAP